MDNNKFLNLFKLLIIGKGNFKTSFSGDLEKINSLIKNKKDNYYSNLEIISDNQYLIVKGNFHHPIFFNLNESPNYIAEFSKENAYIHIELSPYYKIFSFGFFAFFISMILFGLGVGLMRDSFHGFHHYVGYMTANYVMDLLLLYLVFRSINNKVRKKLTDDFSLSFKPR